MRVAGAVVKTSVKRSCFCALFHALGGHSDTVEVALNLSFWQTRGCCHAYRLTEPLLFLQIERRKQSIENAGSIREAEGLRQRRKGQAAPEVRDGDKGPSEADAV